MSNLHISGQPETQYTVHQWCKGTFPQYDTLQKRALAQLEETTELAIACGVDSDDIRGIVNVQLLRQEMSGLKGDIKEEIADVQISLFALAGDAGLDVQMCLEDKMEKNRSHDKSYFDAKHAVKVEAGLRGI